MGPRNKSDCSRFQELIEVHLDGELGANEAAAMGNHLESCALCSDEYRTASLLRSELQVLPKLKCPAGVTDRVFDEIGSHSPSRMRSFLAGLFTRPAWRPRLGAAAAMLAIVVAVGSIYVARHRPEPVTYTAEELARAEADVKWTLAYISEIGRRTGLTVRDDVIRTRVLKPTRDAMKSAFGHEDSGAAPGNNGGST